MRDAGTRVGVAIGGGVSRAGEPLWGPLTKALADSLSRDDYPVPRIVHAELSDDAGLHGAAIAARKATAGASQPAR